MATIGTFTASENGFTGTIYTLGRNVTKRIVYIRQPLRQRAALTHLRWRRRTRSGMAEAMDGTFDTETPF